MPRELNRTIIDGESKCDGQHKWMPPNKQIINHDLFDFRNCKLCDCVLVIRLTTK